MAPARSLSPSTSTPTTPSPNKLPKGAPVMDALPLADVRVLEGPFLEAQQHDEAYLLKLEAIPLG